MSLATPPVLTDSDLTRGGADQRRLAFNVLDAVDDVRHGLGALRAVRQLAANDAGPDGLVQLQRQDLDALIGMISADLEARCAKARAAADLVAKAV